MKRSKSKKGRGSEKNIGDNLIIVRVKPYLQTFKNAAHKLPVPGGNRKEIEDRKEQQEV